jgi:drug/metabolite transporter (DMT)-like permease
VLLAEPITTQQAIGGGLIISSVVLLNLPIRLSLVGRHGTLEETE